MYGKRNIPYALTCGIECKIACSDSIYDHRVWSRFRSELCQTRFGAVGNPMILGRVVWVAAPRPPQGICVM
ncbi:uncharacterized protein BP01DRAFT_211285 [Aspergillus saccharolyticus JOP 1030-1]|uniref:Uncharacterized protein n=1 Tax=Aspergillus saccharolyticus JOP 1030-1 TaxID=1450539 RepID=A0A318Z2D0_9EURO|nr:hypothetical protein BP01DRAFT_211285 [Aspergillus saccharolyticus JOP 1030-1]PYH40447.1 hypothetical protein BP01DRAFT_211285 [Aspergillus saccharolyticus JOP 1030-1]